MVFCAGGSDPGGALEQLLAWTVPFLPHIEKRYLVGRHSTGACAQRLGGAQWVYGGEHAWLTPFARRHLREAALVVTTFGITPYECLYYRTPVLVVGHTDENKAAAETLHAQMTGAATFTEDGCLNGALATLTGEKFTQWMQDYWDCRTERQAMHAASAGLLDGRGVERVADAILHLGG